MPPRSERRAQKKAGDNAVLIITVDGQRYHFDSAEITSAMDRELFLDSKGLTLARVVTSLADGAVSPFMVAALVFLSRRAAGDQVTYTEVEQAIGFASEIDVEIPDGGEDSGPEALAAD